MRKGKKLIALLLGMSMVATCFSACGSSDSGDDAAATATTDAKGENSGGDVKVDVDKVQTGSITKPEAVPNNADAKKVTLKVWCPTEEQTITQELCKVFDEAHPEFDLKCDIAVVSEADASTQLTNDPAASADVFMFAGDQLAELAQSSLIAPIADSISTEVKNSHIEASYNACTQGDKLYAIPFTANLWYMFYNKSMYTTDEVVSLDTMMAKEFPDVNGKPVYNFSVDINNGWYIGGFFYAGGCTLYGPNGDDPTQCDWAEDKGIAVVDYLSKMVDTERFWDDTDYDSIAKLEEGTLGAFCTGSWNANAIKKALGDNYAAAVVPQITVNGTSEYVKPFADYKMLGVNALCKEQQAAQLLAQFLGGDYAQAVRLQTRETQPTVKSIIEGTEFNLEQDYPAVAASLAQLEHTVARPSVKQIASYWTPAQGLGGYIFKRNDKVRNDQRQQFVAEKIVAKIVAK